MWCGSLKLQCIKPDYYFVKFTWCVAEIGWAGFNLWIVKFLFNYVNFHHTTRWRMNSCLDAPSFTQLKSLFIKMISSSSWYSSTISNQSQAVSHCENYWYSLMQHKNTWLCHVLMFKAFVQSCSLDSNNFKQDFNVTLYLMP